MVPKTAALKARVISGALKRAFSACLLDEFEFLGRCPRLPVKCCAFGAKRIGSLRPPLHDVVDAGEQMRNGFFRFISHI